MRLRRVPVLALLAALLFPLSSAAAAEPAVGPQLNVVIPALSNNKSFPVFGQTVPGTQVTVDGHKATVEADGSFEGWLTVTKSKDVTITATDAAGQTTTVTQPVILTGTPPSLTTMPLVAVVGNAVPGTVVTVNGDTKGTPAKAGADGIFRFMFPRLTLGDNRMLLKLTPPQGAVSYQFFSVFHPVDLDTPTETTLTGVAYRGQVLKGYTLSINGQPTALDSAGQFVFQPDLVPGDNTFHLVITTPTGTTYSAERHIFYAADLKDQIKDGIFTYQYQGAPGTLVFVAGKAYWTDASGKLAVPVALKSGQNAVDVLRISPTGAVGGGTYHLIYTLRKVRMNLGSTRATVGDQTQEIPVAPRSIEGYSYVPLRFLAEALGAKVDWDAATSTATFTLGDKTVSVTLDSANATVNGQTKIMVAPARLVDDRTLVPVRFVSENLGAQVDWDEATQGITITLK